ncbi:MAG: 2-oxo acid dehydrogenase subunit E2, partial [Bacteroidales bacterium]|nr:2-oxo acid dehydrogenase subunit E2 [Bacteroidales bacterium]
MATVVIMPKQGQSVESCIIASIKQKGEEVKKGDILFAYETDKASFEEESQVDGVVLECLYNEGDEVPVLTNVMIIGQPGEDVSALLGDSAPAEAAPAAPAAEAAPAASPAAPAAVESAPIAAAPVAASGEKFISPRARNLAEKELVNLDVVAGTGPQGRIIERDVQAAIAAGNKLTGKAKAMLAEGGLQAPAQGSGLAGTVKAGDLKVAQPNHTDIPGEGEDFKVVKMSNMRKLIANAMYNSLQNSAQLTHHLGADARRLQALRKKAKKAYEEGRIKANVTINDLVCFAVVKALQKFPNVNSHCLGDAMRLFEKVHLGLAVDTERGLMVPAVKNADDLSIIGLSNQLKKVAEDCKKGCINPDLLSSQAASFTVSNLGNYGVE